MGGSDSLGCMPSPLSVPHRLSSSSLCPHSVAMERLVGHHTVTVWKHGMKQSHTTWLFFHCQYIFTVNYTIV